MKGVAISLISRYAMFHTAKYLFCFLLFDYHLQSSWKNQHDIVSSKDVLLLSRVKSRSSLSVIIEIESEKQERFAYIHMSNGSVFLYINRSFASKVRTVEYEPVLVKRERGDCRKCRCFSLFRIVVLLYR